MPAHMCQIIPQRLDPKGYHLLFRQCIVHKVYLKNTAEENPIYQITKMEFVTVAKGHAST